MIKTKTILAGLAAALIAAGSLIPTRALAQEAPPTPAIAAEATTVASEEKAPPTLEQRIAGLEAYINNVDPAGSKVEAAAVIIQPLWPGPATASTLLPAGSTLLM